MVGNVVSAGVPAIENGVALTPGDHRVLSSPTLTKILLDLLLRVEPLGVPTHPKQPDRLAGMSPVGEFIQAELHRIAGQLV